MPPAPPAPAPQRALQPAPPPAPQRALQPAPPPAPQRALQPAPPLRAAAAADKPDEPVVVRQVVVAAPLAAVHPRTATLAGAPLAGASLAAAAAAAAAVAAAARPSRRA